MIKTVHIMYDVTSYESAMCGFSSARFTNTNFPNEEPHGWCVVGYMNDYRSLDEWAFCKDCLTSDNYALFLLGDVG
jgi:hypothetical protein